MKEKWEGTGWRGREDAFGSELCAYLEKGDAMEIVEREDGYISAGPNVPQYFSQYRDWPAFEHEAIRRARGRTVDVGCGAGRVCLYLQQKKIPVTGIDNSPGALEVCRRRGVENVKLMPFSEIDDSLGPVDTWIMFGNNAGLFESRDCARRLLKRMHSLSAPGAVILAESTDTSRRTDDCHAVYREWNLHRGRMPGQTRVRVRHGWDASPWFDYLYVSKAEFRELLDDTGWTVTEYLDGGSEEFIAVVFRA